MILITQVNNLFDTGLNDHFGTFVAEVTKENQG
jgi:hypothetical protein